jgi:anthranilate phosphoribosyltransferase
MSSGLAEAEPGEVAAVGIDEVGGWPGVLGRLFAGRTLSSDEAEAVLVEILAGRATPAQVGAFVASLRVRQETAGEMTGLVRAMRRFAERVPTSADVVDTCGTGGDGSGSVNISTMAAFVVAGAGVPVCKHGGRAASSRSGSADVLEALGVAIELGPEGVAACIEAVGMGFCFAPRFHPAMRNVAPVRRELGTATVFNFLGPLVNPAGARRQVVGVAVAGLEERLAEVLAAEGAERALVVRSDDGLDELSTAVPSTMVEVSAGGELHRHRLDPSRFGLRPLDREALVGGAPAENALAVRAVLEGRAGGVADVVLLNAAAGIVVAGRSDDFESALELAERSLQSGRAAAVLEGLIRCSQVEWEREQESSGGSGRKA